MLHLHLRYEHADTDANTHTHTHTHTHTRLGILAFTELRTAVIDPGLPLTVTLDKEGGTT
jgi:hypothetical protein